LGLHAQLSPQCRVPGLSGLYGCVVWIADGGAYAGRQPMIDEGDMAADGHSGAPHERELAQLAVVEAEGHPGARFRHRHGELAVRDLLFGAHLELTVAAANA